MFKKGNPLLIAILFILTTIIVTTICYANAAEPPSILIIVPNAPDDLEISINSNNTYSNARRTDKFLESYYTFYRNDLKATDYYTIETTTAGNLFEITLERPLKVHNNIFTLNIENQTLTPGKLLSRSIVLVSIRIILTLIIEGLIFLLFQYRQKSSWISFFVINLFTQGALNIWLNTTSPLQSYIILTLIFGEIKVFIVEIICFLIFVQEHSRLRIFLYVLIANFISLVLGGYLITLMPI